MASDDGARTTSAIDEEIRGIREEERARIDAVRRDYDRRVRQAKARDRDAKARDRAAERRAENHAKYVIGGIVLSCFPDGWQSVDWDRLARAIRKAGPTFAKMVVPEGERPADMKEAKARLRDWEKRDRDS